MDVKALKLGIAYHKNKKHFVKSSQHSKEV